jgi:hypothetical protein
MATQHQIVEDLETFKETCPTFITNILISDFEYSEDPVEYGADYRTFEECALKNCHHKHRKGFILKTKCGKYFNIGQYCGKTHLGANYKEWTEGAFAQFRAVSQRVRLAREPIEFRRDFDKGAAKIRSMERANNFIWDQLAPFAQEAARRKGEQRLRGLSFLAGRVVLKPTLDRMRAELGEIIQHAENRESMTEDARVSLLKKLTVLKTQLRNMNEKLEPACRAFFGSEDGHGSAERGTNLERIYKAFSSISKIPTIDVYQYPESIYVPSLNRRVSAFGVFKVNQ